ncbi:MAG TPA: rRNA adenine dimethyltransferase family protein, partial [Ktedonobacterales bacterium]|nr:rRNA adenine dimethyltransferase family protein [Ktedonobacterales bacterium]
MKQSHAADDSPDLTSPAVLSALLRRHGLHTKKGLGQHLLVDRDALEAIVAAVGLGIEDAPDAVLEVGAGPGALTVELAHRARRVIAVELDHAMVGVLHETTARFDNVEIIEGDLLKVDPEAVFGVEPYLLAANLPYYITAAALRHFIEATHSPRRMVVMTQREVAERMVAAPGAMSLLSVSVQFYGRPTLVRRVP